MRKVINSKTYRTHTAQLIVTLPSPLPQTDNKWHITHLYQNQQGAYFLAGEGGSLSRWAKLRRVGLSQEKALNRYPKMKHGPTLNTLGFRQTGLRGLGSFKKKGLLPKGKG